MCNNKINCLVDKKFGKRTHYVSAMKYLPQVNFILRGMWLKL